MDQATVLMPYGIEHIAKLPEMTGVLAFASGVRGLRLTAPLAKKLRGDRPCLGKRSPSSHCA